jgi:hypothetical protein
MLLAETPSDPKTAAPWPLTSIFEGPSTSEGLTQADLDGDGLVDLVGGGRWFKYAGDRRYIANVIDDAQRFSRAAAGQLKKGGFAEVVFVVGDDKGRLRWYEWSGDSWRAHDLLDVDVIHGHSLALADFDQDGNMDIFCGRCTPPAMATRRRPGSSMAMDRVSSKRPYCPWASATTNPGVPTSMATATSIS